MDLLIKNMEIPKDGTLRLIIFPNGRVDEINPYNEACMSTDAKAVEVPAHGELVQYLDVKNAIVKAVGKDNPLWCDIMDVVDADAPIVLEAST